MNAPDSVDHRCLISCDSLTLGVEQLTGNAGAHHVFRPWTKAAKNRHRGRFGHPSNGPQTTEQTNDERGHRWPWQVGQVLFGAVKGKGAALRVVAAASRINSRRAIRRAGRPAA
jgi:hypothetical protein